MDEENRNLVAKISWEGMRCFLLFRARKTGCCNTAFVEFVHIGLNANTRPVRRSDPASIRKRYLGGREIFFKKSTAGENIRWIADIILGCHRHGRALPHR